MQMDFTLTEEQTMLRDMVRKFAEAEMKPLAEKIDQEEKTPPELIKKMAEMGLLGLPWPEKYGGAGVGETGYCIAVEEVARACSACAVLMGAHTGLCSAAIYLDGSDELKERYLPSLAQGQKIGCYCLTEASAGSDAAAIETSATQEGDEWVLRGTKLFVTNGGIADVYAVFAANDRYLGPRGGITGFVVERGAPGLEIGQEEHKLGIRGSSTVEVHLEDCRVPAENVIGQVGNGFYTAMKALDMGRLGLGAACLGAAKETLDVSIKHAAERVQFGQPIINHGMVQAMLADMAMEIYAMEGIVYRTAWMVDQGMKFSREAGITKLFCSEALDRIVDKGVQIHGGMGYMREMPLERFYRDSRINRLFEGTNEIQRIVIARDLAKKGSY
jgi:alkylation response protein AidB-like acyl-CoA dehydrogenase